MIGLPSRGAIYMTLNIVSAVAVVLVNKTVLSTLKFHFTICLTMLHTIAAMAALEVCTRLHIFERKELRPMAVLPIAVSYVGYIALSTLSLQINSVAFYTIAKVGVVPCVMMMEVVLLHKRFTAIQYFSVALVCIGATICTVTDLQISTTTLGAVIALSSILTTSMYQLWAGSKQRELDASSAQLLHQSSPYAVCLLAMLVAIFEPVVPGSSPGRGSIIGYQYSVTSVCTITLSCMLGVLVSLSTFLTIGATSSLFYNVVGHIKTVSNLIGGYLLFGDTLTPLQLCGVALALAGITCYSQQSATSVTSLRSANQTSQDKVETAQTDQTTDVDEAEALLGASKHATV